MFSPESRVSETVRPEPLQRLAHSDPDKESSAPAHLRLIERHTRYYPGTMDCKRLGADDEASSDEVSDAEENVSAFYVEPRGAVGCVDHDPDPHRAWLRRQDCHSFRN